MRTAYLPIEVPPAITTKSFSEFCGRHYKELAATTHNLVKKSTTYETFSAPRPTGGRRTMSIVHPLAQIGLSTVITKHREKIKRIIEKRGTSLYRTQENVSAEKAFAGLDFRRWDIERARRRGMSLHSHRRYLSVFLYRVHALHSLGSHRKRQSERLFGEQQEGAPQPLVERTRHCASGMSVERDVGNPCWS